MESSKNKNKTLAFLWVLKRSKKTLPIIGIVAMLSAVMSICSVVLALHSKQVLDIATGAADGELFDAAIKIVVIIAVQLLSWLIQFYLNAYSSAKLTVSLRSYLFDVITTKKYAEIKEYHSGDLLTRLTADGDTVVNSVVNIIPDVFFMVSRIIGGIAALMILNSTIAFTVLGVGLFVPIIGRLINKPFKKLHVLIQQSESDSRVFMQESFENTAILKTFSSSLAFKNKLKEYLKRNFKFKMKRTKVSLVTNFGLFFLWTVGYYFIMLWGADGIMKGAVTYGTLTAFLQLFQQLSGPLQSISGILPRYYSMIASAERLIELEELDNDMAIADYKEIHKLKKEFKTLEADSVSFAYDKDEILDNFSFVAKKGTISAIVGGSGSGKSTLLKLILALYDPAQGKITVNGERVVDASLRPLFAYVPQNSSLFSGTVRDNLTLMNNNVSDEALEKATRAADIYDFLSSLPDGFDTVLSERGSGFSEGQLQRLSVARALLTDAPVLLLDEATSALDEMTESKVLDNIKAMTEKTIIFVTHRNTSLRVCDNIIRIN